MRFDVIVIGAGPAGAGAALLLAAAGWSVALVEKTVFPRRKVCGEFISAPTHAVLDACGIGDAFRAQAGPPVRRIALFAGKSVVMAPRERDWGCALGREHLDVLLCDMARQAGAIVLQPIEVSALERRDNGYLCQLDDGRKLAARVLIAATGSWQAKAPFAVAHRDKASDLLAFKAHFTASMLPADTMPLLAFPGGYGGMVHTDGGRTSLSCCIRRDRLAALRKPGDKAGDAVLRHIIGSTSGAHAALAQSPLEGPILSAGPIRPGIRPRYQDGIFFTGNLAGEAHPVIAEGISMALQSSWLLTRHLIAAGPRGNLDGVGAGYEAAWLRRFAPRIAAASLFAQAAIRARGPGAALARCFPPLLSWGAALSGKTGFP